MKRALIALALLFSPALGRAADVYSFSQFSGLNTDDAPLTLTNGQTPDSENVITDDGPGLRGRKGFVQYSTEPASGLWDFPLSNGTRYIIVKTPSGRLKATTSSNPGAFTINISTVPTDRITAATVLGDKFYFADTLNGLKYWDGSNVGVVGSTLTFDKLVTWKGRLVGAGISGATRVIYLSRYLVGSDFTLETNATDDGPSQITVAGSLDEAIQALYPSFQDKLTWFKINSFGAIYGSRRSNFAQRTFSDSIGVSSVETIRDCDGYLRWLGANRIVWEFDGATFKKISEPIDTMLSFISQGDSSSRSATITSQGDFQNVTASPTSAFDTTTSVGDILPKTTTYTDASPGLSGTFTQSLWVDTETVSGSLQTTFPDPFSSLRDGTGGTKKVYTTHSNCASNWVASNGNLEVVPNCGSGDSMIYSSQPLYSNSSGATYYFDVVVATGGVAPYWGLTGTLPTSLLNVVNVSTTNRLFISFDAGTATTIRVASIAAWNSGNGFFDPKAIDATPVTTVNLPAKMVLFLSSSLYRLEANGTTLASGSHSWNTGADYLYFGTFNGAGAILRADNFSVTPQTFTYTSQGFDTGITPPYTQIWGTRNSTATASNNGSVSLFTQSSSDGSTWDSRVSIAQGAKITSARKQYFRYQADFNAPISTSVASLDSASFSAVTSTPQFVATFTPGSNISAWGPVAFNDLRTGATIAYEVSASSTGVFSSWTSIASGATPSIATNTFAGIRASFTLGVATDSARVSDLTISWTEGSTVRAASSYFANRYWLSVASGSSTNNRIFVFDKQRQWQRYTGINADILTLYSSQLYFGNSSGIFQNEQTYSDNGTAIVGYFRTPTVAPSGLDLFSKFIELHTISDPSDATLTTSYQLNDSGTYVTLSTTTMNSTSGIQNLKFPFPIEEVQQSRYVNTKWSVSGTTFWRILAGNIYFDKDVVPQ